LNKVTMKLENCYGIRKMQKCFDFTNKAAYILYASNGCMKTSFAKTLKDISEGITPKEEVYGRKPAFVIKNENDVDVNKDEIFVIESYNENYYSKRVSNLLMNRTLQEKYNLITQKILDGKNDFINKINGFVGENVKVEEEVLKSFNSSDFFKVLTILCDENFLHKEDSGLDFSKIQYDILFDKKVEDFVKDSGNFELLNEYINEYDKLVEASTFLKKGTFSQYNAVNVSTTLANNGFFRAGHEIHLQDGTQVKSSEEFNKRLQEEKAKVLSDPTLLTRFNKIDKKLNANPSLRSFRNIIENNPDLVSKLLSYDSFREKAWISILKKENDVLSDLLELYKKVAEEIKIIHIEAKKENTEWRKVVEIFLKRFFVPFGINIDNQEDVVLHNSIPSISFVFNENGEGKGIELKKLNSILSGGEKRALYLLNIIFELEAIKKTGKKVLVVADDIAESFDYKNKYAIIEYLMESYSSGLFNFILLTHNFDFYRTIGSRMLNYDREHCVMVNKNAGEIEIKNGAYLRNVFGGWKDRLETSPVILVAAIPFIRNIVEYIEHENSVNYMFLTKLLHITNYGEGKKTKDICLKDLQQVINDVWRTEKKITNQGGEDYKVYDMIISVANKISSDKNIDEINLENKIALSMAARLLAEQFMIKEIININNSDEKIKEIENSKHNQTGKLLAAYKSITKVDNDAFSILEEVSLITVENIHLNSFMYEPLIDISIRQLIKTYEGLKRVMNIEVN